MIMYPYIEFTLLWISRLVHSICEPRMESQERISNCSKASA